MNDYKKILRERMMMNNQRGLQNHNDVTLPLPPTIVQNQSHFSHALGSFSPQAATVVMFTLLGLVATYGNAKDTTVRAFIVRPLQSFKHILQ